MYCSLAGDGWMSVMKCQPLQQVCSSAGLWVAATSVWCNSVNSICATALCVPQLLGLQCVRERHGPRLRGSSVGDERPGVCSRGCRVSHQLLLRPADRLWRPLRQDATPRTCHLCTQPSINPYPASRRRCACVSRGCWYPRCVSQSGQALTLVVPLQAAGATLSLHPCTIPAPPSQQWTYVGGGGFWPCRTFISAACSPIATLATAPSSPPPSPVPGTFAD